MRSKDPKNLYKSDTELAKEIGQLLDVKAESGRHWIKLYKKKLDFRRDLETKALNPKKNGTVGHVNSSNRGRLTYDIALDQEVADWVYFQMQISLPPSRQDVKDFAFELIKSTSPKFKASDHWLSRFMNRHGLSIRQPNDKAPQQLGLHWQNQLIAFTDSIKEFKAKENINERFILNMDETPVFHEYLSQKVVAIRGEGRVEAWRQGKEKKKTSLILTISAAGDMLDPGIILDRETSYKLKCRNRIGLKIFTSSSGWMNEAVMLQWLIYPWVGQNKGILIFDSYAAHCTENVINSIAQRSQLFIAVIPGGLTFKLQPLDVCINRPFKNLLKKESRKYHKELAKAKLRENAHALTAVDPLKPKEVGAADLKNRIIYSDEKKPKAQKKNSKLSKREEVVFPLFPFISNV
jgi:hypothetical protein